MLDCLTLLVDPDVGGEIVGHLDFEALLQLWQVCVQTNNLITFDRLARSKEQHAKYLMRIARAQMKKSGIGWAYNYGVAFVEWLAESGTPRLLEWAVANNKYAEAKQWYEENKEYPSNWWEDVLQIMAYNNRDDLLQWHFDRGFKWKDTHSIHMALGGFGHCDGNNWDDRSSQPAKALATVKLLRDNGFAWGSNVRRETRQRCGIPEYPRLTVADRKRAVRGKLP